MEIQTEIPDSSLPFCRVFLRGRLLKVGQEKHLGEVE